MSRNQFSTLDKARAQIVLDHPFVASILLRHPLTATESVPTLGVDKRGKIYYNPKFVETLSVPQLVWALAHEVFHRVGQHAQRQGTRDHNGWNYATDAWINDTLTAANIGTPIENTVNMPGSKDETCEDIYAKLPKRGQKSGQGQGGKGKGQKGKGKGQSSPQGNGPGEGDGEYEAPGGLGNDLINDGPDLTESEAKELEAQVKLEVAEAAQAAKMRGKLPGVLAEFAHGIIESKTPWFDILERFMTESAKVDFTWTRPNRRYQPDYYLPSLGSQNAMGEIVLQVDISGSVSAKEIEYYNGHVSRIIEQCRPTKVHVIYTDTQVQHHDTFEQDQEVKINFYSGGGTHMPAGFDYITDKGINPAVFVTLTDGYTAFPSDVPCPAVWCISSEVKAPPEAGETVHFEMD
jgi:predicted metal-dependent peptidase